METEGRSSSTRRAEEPLIAGKVYLVGAGPGDPALLTLRAAELLRAADVVILDAQVAPDIVARISSHARIIDPTRKKGGKKEKKEKEKPEKSLDEILLEEGRKGKIVVRLQPGDPFVFGRGGHEAELLRQAGVPFEVVPGIPASMASPAYAGIPVTHRNGTPALTLVHLANEEAIDELDWSAIGALRGTLVLTGDHRWFGAVAARLTEKGAIAGSTPVAAVAAGTTRRQRTIAGTLATIGSAVESLENGAHSLLVVGAAAAFQETLSWFESKPLFGRTIVITRARAQSSGFVRLLENEGASVVQFPMIEMRPPESWESLDEVIARLSSYAWLVFSSTNGVETFFDRLKHHGRDLRSLASSKVAAVGETTASALHNRGIIPDLVPEKFQATALIPHFPENLEGVEIAIIRAAAGKDDLVMELRHRGARVDLGVAYETRATRGLREQLGSMLGSGRIDAITFTSGSTVDNFFEQLSDEDRKDVISKTLLASIGPVTSEALRAHGAEPGVEAAEATIHGLTTALVEHFAGT